MGRCWAGIVVSCCAFLASTTPGPAEGMPLRPSLRFAEKARPSGLSPRYRFHLRVRVPVSDSENPDSLRIRIGSLDVIVPLREGRGRARFEDPVAVSVVRVRAGRTGDCLHVRVDGSFAGGGSGVVPRETYSGRIGPVLDLLEAEVTVGDRSFPFGVGVAGWIWEPTPRSSDPTCARIRGLAVCAESPGPHLLHAAPPPRKRWMGRVAGLAVSYGEPPDLSMSLDEGAPEPIEGTWSRVTATGAADSYLVAFDTPVQAREGPHFLRLEARAAGASVRRDLSLEVPAIPAVVEVGMGTFHYLEIREDGTIAAQGVYYDNALGRPLDHMPLAPLLVEGPLNARSVAAGDRFSFVADGRGDVWLWGNMPWGAGWTPRPRRLDGLEGVRRIAAGSDHALFLLESGAVLTWGLSPGSPILGGPPDSFMNRPQRMQGMPDIVDIAAGEDSSLALGADGSVWQWGGSAFDDEGLKVDPLRVTGLPPCRAIATGHHSLAVAADGTVWGWGQNRGGQLGDGTRTDRSSPAPVPGLPPIRSVVSAFWSSLALDEEGRVWGWGDNSTGQLGDGTIEDRLAPVRVPGLRDVRQITGGSFTSMALDGDGAVWIWGWIDDFIDTWELQDAETKESQPILMRRREQDSATPSVR